MKKVLLVEPGYRNKYPPLGLMKISTYHKLRGDEVKFVKGCVPDVRGQNWDRVYVSTLFTFFWKEICNTIKYYLRCVDSPQDIVLGGVAATLLQDEIRQQFSITVMPGLLDKPGILDPKSRYVVDHLMPDYGILDQIDYQYGLEDAYLGYATRGCPNSCSFCAVKQIEPAFVHYLPLKRQVRGIEELHGTKRHLVLLDNNVMASDQFDTIINDIVELGFHRGAKLGPRLRRVDFNQGIDARRLTVKKMRLLSRIALSPVRFAFDSMALRKQYVTAIEMARDVGLLRHSTYVLYNYADTPEDFYKRLRLNATLNERLGTRISSFPMRYVPLTAKDRSFVGKHWSKRLIRGVQCILLATKGMVSPRLEFFEAAFGSTAEEFVKIALMPEDYIVHRERHKANGASEWSSLYSRLGKNQWAEFLELVSARQRITEQDVTRQSGTIKKILRHYVEGDNSHY